MNHLYFIGIDIGTQGARVVIVDEEGTQHASAEEIFELTGQSREEQSPLAWWESCSRILPRALAQVENPQWVKAIAVTSTSGTIIPIDKNYQPLHAAIMYSDPRSAAEAKRCKDIAERSNVKGYTAFNASSGLPKMCWYLNHFPEKKEQLYQFIHAADFINGRLTGIYEVTDYTNAMKSGYDLHNNNWPSYISEELGIRPMWLQKVRPSGEPVAFVLPALAAAWGIRADVMVTTGMTDGCASQVASGAVSPGQWNTTIGTTLVIKGVTTKELVDPSGAIYNHRHPSGYWMPGGASNTGADWVSKMFGERNLVELGNKAGRLLPSELMAWPLLQQGERFPFVAPEARGFWPEDQPAEAIFAACMEGVAFIERYAYLQVKQLSGEKIKHIFSAGGGSNNDTWLRIRSSVLNKPVKKMKNVTGAAGAAVLAASKTHYRSLEEAAAAMVHPETTIDPEPALTEPYRNKYELFINELIKRKILPALC